MNLSKTIVSLEVEKGQGDGSVSEVSTTEAQGPEFRFPEPMEKTVYNSTNLEHYGQADP